MKKVSAENLLSEILEQYPELVSKFLPEKPPAMVGLTIRLNQKTIDRAKQLDFKNLSTVLRNAIDIGLTELESK